MAFNYKFEQQLFAMTAAPVSYRSEEYNPRVYWNVPVPPVLKMTLPSQYLPTKPLSFTFEQVDNDSARKECLAACRKVSAAHLYRDPYYVLNREKILRKLKQKSKVLKKFQRENKNKPWEEIVRKIMNKPLF